MPRVEGAELKRRVESPGFGGLWDVDPDRQVFGNISRNADRRGHLGVEQRFGAAILKAEAIGHAQPHSVKAFGGGRRVCPYRTQ